METKSNASFDEKQKMTDLLSSEKYLAATYNAYRLESATGSIKSCLASIHEDEHRIADEIFCEMNARGWYPTESAEATKIQSTKRKFEQQATK
jgi:hypothetical protein